MSNLKLRVLGTSATLLEEVRRQACADLGFDLEFDVLNGVDCQQKGVTSPDEFDVYDQWFHSIDLLWTAGSIQPIDIGRIEMWPEVSNLTKTGRLRPSDKLGQGARPVDLMFVQDDWSLGSNPSGYISCLPTANNVDSFGYDPAIISDPSNQQRESWAWLFDDRWHGRCGLLADPAIGVVDVALAAQAANRMRFEDIGNMTIEEIDELIDLLIEKKRSGHFRSFWSNVDESVTMMERRGTMVAAMWSPAIFALRAKGRLYKSASPIEGYRAWHSGLCLSSSLSDEKRNAAYAYLNWWLSGKAGAIVARQGFYMSVLETTRQHLSEDEWNYWYEGQPATTELCDPHGATIVSKGEIRDGGSYWDRLSNIAVWNTLMDEHNYMVRRWNEFLAA